MTEWSVQIAVGLADLFEHLEDVALPVAHRHDSCLWAHGLPGRPHTPAAASALFALAPRPSGPNLHAERPSGTPSVRTASTEWRKSPRALSSGPPIGPSPSASFRPLKFSVVSRWPSRASPTAAQRDSRIAQVVTSSVAEPPQDRITRCFAASRESPPPRSCQVGGIGAVLSPLMPEV